MYPSIQAKIWGNIGQVSDLLDMVLDSFIKVNGPTGTSLPYLTLPPGWAGSYICPALRPYQSSPMRVPKYNHKVTGNGYKAVDGCEAINRRL